MKGTIQEVLIEGRHYRRENFLTGRSRGYHSLLVKDCGIEIGKILPVRITGTNKSSLMAEPI